jgi:soluble lytic murein transglycosylase-like protein
MSKIMFIWLLTLLWIPAYCWAETYAFEYVGKKYDIAPELLRAISKVESEQNNTAVNHNANGSTDVCHMQINSSWEKKIGYSWNMLDNPAYCTLVGAWILKGCIDQYGYNWGAVACYHTGYSINDAPTERKRENGLIYIQKVQEALDSPR